MRINFDKFLQRQFKNELFVNLINLNSLKVAQWTPSPFASKTETTKQPKDIFVGASKHLFDIKCNYIMSLVILAIQYQFL